MADGRVFTSYLPNCELNAALQKQYGTNDVHAYRYFLQQNAEKLIAESFQNDDKPCTLCPVCKDSVEYKP